MSDEIATILDAHERLLAAMDAEAAEAAAEKARLQTFLDKCDQKLREISLKREALHTASELYKRAFRSDECFKFSEKARLAVERYLRLTPESSPSPLPDSKPKRARIGPQRYLMLDTLRAIGDMSIDQLILLTGLPPRRVKDQMASDVSAGVVNEDLGGLLRITDFGKEFMGRYEESRKSRGLPLPTLADAIKEEHGASEELETQEGGE